LSRADVAGSVGCTEASVRDWEDGRARAVGAAIEYIIPSADYREKLAGLLDYSADERQRIGVETTNRTGDGTVIGLGHSGELRSGGHTDASAKWAGWGTALKPGREPIVVARKPLDGTVATNVLEHGTGAINIDGCRIATTDNLNGGAHAIDGAERHDGAENWRYKIGGAGEYTQPTGRWPANVIFTHSAACDDGDACVCDCPVRQLDEQSGITTSGAMKREVEGYEGTSTTPFLRGRSGPSNQHGGTGGASRFFYTAKTSRKERNAGCERLENGNDHPTVKPIELMRYLVRLVTPPGGLVLDPFTGSGSTGCAAILEGCRFIGIDLERHHIDIAGARMLHWLAVRDAQSDLAA
jgi:site-specific DNA-methyltransferase (adenine-specific)